METPNLNEARKGVAEELILKFRRNASALKLKATGSLDDSFGYEIVNNELQIFANEYAEALNNGTSPASGGKNSAGKIDRIRAWIKAKGIRPLTKNKYGNTTFAKYKNSTSKYNAYDRMAFAMARSISNKGIIKRFGYSGTPFIDKIIQEQKTEIKAVFSSAFKKDIEMELNKNK